MFRGDRNIVLLIVPVRQGGEIPKVMDPATDPVQCAISTGRFACARIWRVAPPKINCRKRLCV